MELLENPTVLGAALAAAAALSGVFVSQLVAIFAAWIQHRRQHRVLLRDKYECVSILLAQSVQWFQTIQAARSLEELQIHAYPTHAREMYGICLVYFPELREAGASYLNSLVLFQHTLVDSFDSSIKASAGAQAHQHTPDEYLEASRVALQARQSMEDGIELHAVRYAAL